MSNWHLYPDRKVVGQDFSGEEHVVVPNQSMSLKEILRRFIKRESLPVERQGVYAEGFGDLEKMMHEDFTQVEERVEELKKKVSDGKKKSSEKAAAEKAAAEKRAKADRPDPKADPAGETASPKAGAGSSDKPA